jgi:hypothetical protein
MKESEKQTAIKTQRGAMKNNRNIDCNKNPKR